MLVLPSTFQTAVKAAVRVFRGSSVCFFLFCKCFSLLSLFGSISRHWERWNWCSPCSANAWGGTRTRGSCSLTRSQADRTAYVWSPNRIKRAEHFLFLHFNQKKNPYSKFDICQAKPEYAAFEIRVHIYLIQVEIAAGVKCLCKESNKCCKWSNTTDLSMS